MLGTEPSLGLTLGARSRYNSLIESVAQYGGNKRLVTTAGRDKDWKLNRLVLQRAESRISTSRRLWDSNT